VRISSKILTNPDASSTSPNLTDAPSASTSHVRRGARATEPMYVSGLCSTCSRCVSLMYLADAEPAADLGRGARGFDIASFALGDGLRAPGS